MPIMMGIFVGIFIFIILFIGNYGLFATETSERMPATVDRHLYIPDTH